MQGSCKFAAAAALEYVRDSAAATQVTRHVLDHTYHRNAELDAKRVLLAHVVERHALRRGDQHRAVQRKPRQAFNYTARSVSAIKLHS